VQFLEWLPRLSSRLPYRLLQKELPKPLLRCLPYKLAISLFPNAFSFIRHHRPHEEQFLLWPSSLSTKKKIPRRRLEFFSIWVFAETRNDTLSPFRTISQLDSL